MRTLIFDYKEFGTPESEEYLCIATDHVKWWKNVDLFYQETCDMSDLCNFSVQDLRPETIVNKLKYRARLIQYLQTYANLLLIGNEKCIPLTEEWNINDYLIYYQHYFVRFHWETTA